MNLRPPAITCAIFCAGGIFLSSPSAIAEDPASDLVSQAESFKDQAKKGAAQPEEEKPEISFEEEKPFFPAPPDEGPEFFLNQIRLEGNTVFREELAPPLQPFENQKTSFGRLRAAAQAVTVFYRSRGYLTSRAYLPPQEAEDGSVTLKVVEGKIGKVLVEGNRHSSREFYESAMRLRADRILYLPDLEASLYQINRNPDRKARAYLSPGDAPGTSDLLLKVEDSAPFHMGYEYNNHGTKLTHRGRNLLRLEHTNLTRRADTLLGALALSEEGAFTGESVSYQLPLGQTGAVFSLDASYSESRLVKHFKSSDVEGTYWSFAPGLTQNLYRTPDVSLGLYAGLDLKDSKSEVRGDKLNFDRIRAFQTGPRLVFQDPFRGRDYLSADVHFGIPDFGGFIFSTVNLVRFQRLPHQSLFYLKCGAQFTGDVLPGTEEYRAGGAYSVRGYPEADSQGDYGYDFQAELQIPPSFLPAKWRVPFTDKTWRDSLKLVGFVDGAKTFLHQKNTPADVKDKFLLGTGGGIRLDLGRMLTAECDLGFPLEDNSSDEKHQAQVHLLIRAGW